MSYVDYPIIDINIFISSINHGDNNSKSSNSNTNNNGNNNNDDDVNNNDNGVNNGVNNINTVTNNNIAWAELDRYMKTQLAVVKSLIECVAKPSFHIVRPADVTLCHRHGGGAEKVFVKLALRGWGRCPKRYCIH